MLEQHRRHLAEWRAESERHVRALIEHQRGIEARLAEAGEYLRIREEEARALTDEVKQLKLLLAQVPQIFSSHIFFRCSSQIFFR